MEILELTDEDLIIDLKFGNTDDIRNLYSSQAAK